jgi:hypothetical protein
VKFRVNELLDLYYLQASIFVDDGSNGESLANNVDPELGPHLSGVLQDRSKQMQSQIVWKTDVSYDLPRSFRGRVDGLLWGRFSLEVQLEQQR